MEFRLSNLLQNFPYLTSKLAFERIVNSAHHRMSDGCSVDREFHKFFHHVRQLRLLQSETLEAIENVGKSGNLSEEQLLELRFNSDETEELRRALHVPTCIVITGQSFYGKLALATRLLGEQIIPVVSIKRKKSSGSYSYRPMQIQFGPLPSAALFKNIFNNEEKEKKPIRIFDSLNLEDFEISNNKFQASLFSDEIVQVTLNHGLLREGLQIFITPSSSRRSSNSFSISSEFLRPLLPSVFPIILFAITKITFTDQELAELRELKESHPKVSVLFLRVPLLPDTFGSDLPESEQHDILCKLGILPMPSLPTKTRSRTRSISQDHSDGCSSDEEGHKAPMVPYQGATAKYHSMPERLLYILCDKIGCLTRKVPPQTLHLRVIDGELQHYNDYADDLTSFSKILNHFHLLLNGQLVIAATLLHQGHSRCMRMFILYAFDMARELQITPRRINYAKEKEAELFDNLIEIASIKQDEIKNVILESLSEIRESLLEKATNYEFKDVELPQNMEELTSRDVRLCTLEIQELVLSTLNEAVGRQLATRLDVMRKSYLGTLQRCLENLEKDCRECKESSNIGNALKQMMNAAYQVEVTSTSSSALRSFLAKMKQLVIAMPGRPPPIIDNEWKNKVALNMLAKLSESKLAKNICAQFRDRLKLSHDSFMESMKLLESQLTWRLEQKEETHLRMKKCDAPRLARMSLESTSIRDMILYGVPVLEREIGRGQYGVVFGCKKWATYRPCAIKSLVPLDDKHWNDLAMEFHYTRSVPEHDRIVALRGSVIDYLYGQGETPAVLLVMERLNRDLYSGIKMGLAWLDRLQVSLDVTQGIRYLHSQGLVHRDIKLKNVLLDPQNRAKLTDLGFCKPEAMMSGSIVGTPIHMAPELFTGHYDNSVDVYAFGILFWYICAGHVKLPLVFEQCHSKDQLWQCVRKGVRPERLSNFNDHCWRLMTQCWAGEPSERPFLGNVEPCIEQMMENSRQNTEKVKRIKERAEGNAESIEKEGNLKGNIECGEDALSQYELRS